MNTIITIETYKIQQNLQQEANNFIIARLHILELDYKNSRLDIKSLEQFLAIHACISHIQYTL